MAVVMLKVAETAYGTSDDDEKRAQQRTDIPPPISERKLRRYSSCEKILVGDSLNVAKNDKISRMMMRNGKELVFLLNSELSWVLHIVRM